MTTPLACPKCSYTRKPTDTESFTQCPKCHLVFAKYKEQAEGINHPRPSNSAIVKEASQAAKPSVARTITGTLVLVVLVLFAINKLSNSTIGFSQEKYLQNIHNQVIIDSLNQYQIVKRNGTPIDACVQAGLVSASYLQAQKESEYREWKSIESSDCKAAGVPR